MTRKDYELIAAALLGTMCRQEHSAAERRGVKDAARDVADALGTDNPRFDRARFLKASGVEA